MCARLAGTLGTGVRFRLSEVLKVGFRVVARVQIRS